MDCDKQGRLRAGLNRAVLGLLFIVLSGGLLAGCSGDGSTGSNSVTTPSSSDPPPLPPPPPPNSSGALTITSSPPPIGIVGLAYGGSHTIFPNTNHCSFGVSVSGWPLRVSGGSANYSWGWSAVPGNTLPAGLNLKEIFCGGGGLRCCSYVPILWGTPTLAGTYRVIVTVTDSA